MPKTKKKRRATKKTQGALPGKVVGEMNGMPVRRVQAGALTGAEYNPRSITDEALEGLANSTKRFGLVQPVVWNKRTQRIVGGHQRLRTLDPDAFTDVIEVNLSLSDEKALNLALNNPHTSGEFTSSLGELIAELETAVPELVTDLKLDSLYVDVPTDVDDLLDGVQDSDSPDDGEAQWNADAREKASEKESTKEDSYSEHKQIVVVLTDEEHTEAIRGFEAVMRNESCESYTEALLWLFENYEESRKAKKKTRRK